MIPLNQTDMKPAVDLIASFFAPLKFINSFRARSIAPNYLDVKAKINDVTFPHYIVLALEPYESFLLGGIHRTGRCNVVITDYLGPDETAFDIGVDLARGLRCLSAD